jgi:predicted amidohydrolase YtcJ
MCIYCNPELSAYIGAAASRRGFLKGLGAATALFATESALPAFAASDRADIIFKGGPIYTMSDRIPHAGAVAVRGEHILAVGQAKDIDNLAGPGTRVVDLGGRTLLPGFVDAHMHYFPAFFTDWIDVSIFTTASMDAVIAKLRAGAQAAGPAGWVRARLFDPMITPGARIPSLAELDDIAPGNPLILQESNGHIAYANSSALKLAGLGRDSPDPAGGRYGRDSNGELTGRLEEPAAMGAFVKLMPFPAPDKFLAALRRIYDTASSTGCTLVHDCSIGALAGERDIAALHAVMSRDPPVRLRGMLVSDKTGDWERLGLKPGQGDDRFRLTGMKAWSDGSNQGLTGYQRDPYLGRESRGALTLSPQALTDKIRSAHAGGWQMGVHANGDAAIDVTIDAYEAVLKDSPRSDHRHRIEHCSLLHPEQMQRMRRLGLSPSFLIGHVGYWGAAFRDKILGPERVRNYDPCASALAAGLRISLHSDFDVTPMGPLRMVEDAVGRVIRSTGETLVPQERIPVAAALRAVTIDAAWQCGADDVAGSIESGKYADFAILDHDPLRIPVANLARVQVSETWMSGRQRYQA